MAGVLTVGGAVLWASAGVAVPVSVEVETVVPVPAEARTARAATALASPPPPPPQAVVSKDRRREEMNRYDRLMVALVTANAAGRFL
ncbi:hypothetical protein GCM10023165_37850 [Variovorax defluvii]|uniref:Uncharacterized protein n=1 Tax=Variovorax defluvii TaxID=913761 RepID=A0ABP8I3L0_9BURK